MKKIISAIKKAYRKNTSGYMATTRYRVRRRYIMFWHWEVTDHNGRHLQSGWSWTEDSAIIEASHWSDCMGFQIRRGVR